MFSTAPPFWYVIPSKALPDVALGFNRLVNAGVPVASRSIHIA